MILIADSGSTKTLWCAAEDGVEVSRVETVGLNPYFHDSESVGRTVAEVAESVTADGVESVFFYGAGCTGGDKNEMIASAVRSCFKSAAVEVYSDMTGAARALLQRESGIACILGTGSNSCLYDGREITDNVPAGGYILGDEGSGAYIGKRLAAEYIKRRMPEDLAALFETECKVSAQDIIENVYRRPFPNRYLAQFTKFIAVHIGEYELLHVLVRDSFTEFFRCNVCGYTGWQGLPVGFVGSVAWHFRDVLRESAESCGVTAGEVVQSPVEGLVEYHKGRRY